MQTVAKTFRALTLLAALVAIRPAAAQEPAATAPAAAPAAVANAPRQTSYLGPPKDTYQVFVFGDSLAAGLFAGMARMAEGDLRLAIDGRFKDDSGLARPEFYDWAAAMPKVLERREIDVAVIFLGANDGQDIRASTGPVIFRTPDWATTYAERVDRVVDILRQRGTAIYWIELPPMGPEPLEEEAKYIATIHRDRALKAKIRFVETRRAFADAEDRYTDRGANSEGTAAAHQGRHPFPESRQQPAGRDRSRGDPQRHRPRGRQAGLYVRFATQRRCAAAAPAPKSGTSRGCRCSARRPVPSRKPR